MADYISRSDIEAVFGVTNVADYADMNRNNDADEIAARIVVAIDYAEARADAVVRGSIYKIPLSFNSGEALWTDLVAKLAGVWLYRLHVRPDETDLDRMWIANIEKQALDTLNMIANRNLVIDAVKDTAKGPTVPRVG